MPIQYRILDAPSYLHLCLSGEVAMDDYFHFFEGVAEDDAFYPSIPTLLEIEPDAHTHFGNTEGEKIGEISEVVARIRGDADYPVAIAGGSPDARSFVAMGQDIVCLASRVAVFESTAVARKWLLEKRTAVPSPA